MMKVSQTGQFKKDIKLQIKRAKDPRKVTELLRYLLDEEDLPESYLDHPLKGNWKGRRDCHLEPDWILIYRLSKGEIRLERTGSHSDLF